MDLVDASIHDVGAEGVGRGNLPPSLVTQMLRIYANDVPTLAFLYFFD
jgi:hypothetical protein